METSEEFSFGGELSGDFDKVEASVVAVSFEAFFSSISSGIVDSETVGLMSVLF